MKNLIVLFTLALGIFASSHTATAQNKYFTKDGQITFNASGNLEAIEATNKKVTSVINAETGAMEFSLLMRAFEFEKALMQEHFNENYVESEKFPKSTFKGKIENISAVNFKKDGTYNVTVSGDLTIHGVTKPVSSKGTITVAGTKITAKSSFEIELSNYGVKIPAVVKDNISNKTKIDVAMQYQPLVKPQ